MFSSISSKLTSAKPLASAFALSQTRKAGVKSIPVFGEEVAAASAGRSAKIPARQISATAKTLAVKAQALATKSLTNKTLATHSSATAKAATTPTALLSKLSGAKAAAEGDDTVTTPPVDPAEAVRAVLTELGYDASKFRFEAREEYVSYPGGGYTHKFTAVELPNGLKENFTTDLMGRFPSVTANELKRLMENQYQTAGNVSIQNFGGGV